MLNRLLSAVIGIPLLLILTWLGGWFLVAMLAVLAALLLYEFLKLGTLMGVRPLHSLVWILAVGWYVLLFLELTHFMLPYLLVMFLVLTSAYTITYPRYTLKDLAWSLCALIYPVTIISCLYPIRETMAHGEWWAMFCFLIVWGTDTGGYVIGTLFGRHKIAPATSPHKSYEGAVGGVVVSLAVGAAFWYFFNLAPLWAVLTVSLIASFFAQMGDMFESALKRTASIKDSGDLIPGHGGFLDRFDSFLFAVPVIFICLHLLELLN
jgi:phosphatidate cytidylyltransferase